MESLLQVISCRTITIVYSSSAVKMGDCQFNGTCSSCTSTGWEFVVTETEKELTCCVADSNSVPGWAKFIARSPSDCPSTSNWTTWQTVFTSLSVLGIVIAICYYAFRRIQANNYRHLPPRTAVRPVFARFQQYERQTPAPINWDEVELDAVVASMEATTAL